MAFFRSFFGIKITSRICFFLSQKGWSVAHYLVAALFGEPKSSMGCAIRKVMGWKRRWERYGFIDASDPTSWDHLRNRLQAKDADAAVPVLLLHGVYSSPDIWLPWATHLKQAQDQGKIGHVVTLQLPNEMGARMRLIRETINKLTELHEQTTGIAGAKVDLIGHSRGGYAAHLAAFASETLHINGMECRSHTHAERNHRVRRVISMAAPTWCYCQTQDLSHHHDIYDICATRDLISPTTSPLPRDQVFEVDHGHLSLTTCADVWNLVLNILRPNQA